MLRIQIGDIILPQTEIVHFAKDNVAVTRHVEELNAILGIALGGRKENVQQIRSEQITTQT